VPSRWIRPAFDEQGFSTFGRRGMHSRHRLQCHQVGVQHNYDWTQEWCIVDTYALPRLDHHAEQVSDIRHQIDHVHH